MVLAWQPNKKDSPGSEWSNCSTTMTIRQYLVVERVASDDTASHPWCLSALVSLDFINYLLMRKRGVRGTCRLFSEGSFSCDESFALSVCFNKRTLWQADDNAVHPPSAVSGWYLIQRETRGRKIIRWWFPAKNPRRVVRVINRFMWCYLVLSRFKLIVDCGGKRVPEWIFEVVMR